MYSYGIDPNHKFVSLEAFQAFCRSFLILYSHITLNQYYQVAKYPTESPNKLIKTCLHACEIPRWLIDICREICRPMVSGSTVYVPYIQEELSYSFEHHYSAIIPVGYVYSITNTLRTFCNEHNLELSSRAIIVESLLSAPLSVADGEYCFIDPVTATWRKSAWYYLQHCRNCYAAPARRSNLYSPKAVMYNPFQEVITCNHQTPVFNDEIKVPEMQHKDNLNATSVLHALMTNTNYREGKLELVVFHWMPERNTTYNSWFVNDLSSNHGLPNCERVNRKITRMMQVCKRFPSEEMRSKTPPQNTVRAQSLKGRRGRKRKPKPDRNVVLDDLGSTKGD